MRMHRSGETANVVRRKVDIHLTPVEPDTTAVACRIVEMRPVVAWTGVEVEMDRPTAVARAAAAVVVVLADCLVRIYYHMQSPCS